MLDDPGTALDLANRDKITESIRKAKASTNATVILTCHDIPMTKALGDDLVVLLGGRVGAAGPVAELLDGVESSDDYDERFSVLASFAQDSPESLAQYKAERAWQVSWEKIVLYTGLAAGLLTLVGVIILVLVNPANWRAHRARRRAPAGHSRSAGLAGRVVQSEESQHPPEQGVGYRVGVDVGLDA